MDRPTGVKDRFMKIRFSQEIAEKLIEKSKREGRSVSEIVREIIISSKCL